MRMKKSVIQLKVISYEFARKWISIHAVRKKLCRWSASKRSNRNWIWGKKLICRNLNWLVAITYALLLVIFGISWLCIFFLFLRCEYNKRGRALHENAITQKVFRFKAKNSCWMHEISVNKVQLSHIGSGFSGIQTTAEAHTFAETTDYRYKATTTKKRNAEIRSISVKRSHGFRRKKFINI